MSSSDLVFQGLVIDHWLQMFFDIHQTIHLSNKRALLLAGGVSRACGGAIV